MSDTRDPQRRGRVPFPVRRHTGLNGRSAPARAGQPPADEELIRQLSVALGEISDVPEPGQPAGGGGPRGAMSRTRLEAAAAKPVSNLARLKRSMQDSLHSAEPDPEETSSRRRYIGPIAPLVALIALVSLGVAGIYVLNPALEAPQKPQTTPPPPSARVAASPSAGKPVSAAAKPVRNDSRPVRVETIRVVPRQAPAMAAVNQSGRPVEKRRPQPDTARRSPPAPERVVPKSPVVTANVTPQRPGTAVRTVSAAVENAMLARGREMMTRVDVAGARLAYRFLAERGSAKGTLALAKSYDPNLLAKMAVVGLTGDRVEAARLYRQAAALGSVEATRRLAQLPGR